MDATTFSHRFYQTILLASFLVWCWLAMQAVHELGHITAATMTGGRVTKVVLHPLAISRTDVSPNPAPLTVVWLGPIGGVILPLLGWGALAGMKSRAATFARFFAGFCLFANGIYLSIGSFDAIGDAGDLLRLGAPTWNLWGFGALTIPLGFYLWNGTGRAFGLGRSAENVSGRAAGLSCFLLALTVTLELLFSESL